MTTSLGTLVFCAPCGNLLDPPVSSSELTCEMCGYVTTDTGTKTVTTTSNPRAFPSSLRLKKSALQALAAEDLQTEAEIQQACPECGNEKMWFYTLQIRSADEGATVFYRCGACGHRFNTNN